MSNRVKKEEKKRGKPFPSNQLSESQWFELINAYEEKRKPNFEKSQKKKKKKLPK